jgi:hypothetical protein
MGNDETVSHPSLRPWKSLARFPHSHRRDDYGEKKSPPQPSELWDTQSEGKVTSLCTSSPIYFFTLLLMLGSLLRGKG